MLTEEQKSIKKICILVFEIGNEVFVKLNKFLVRLKAGMFNELEHFDSKLVP